MSKYAYILNQNQTSFPIGMNDFYPLDSRYSNQNLISYLKTKLKPNQGFILFECDSLMDECYKCIHIYNSSLNIKPNTSFDANQI